MEACFRHVIKKFAQLLEKKSEMGDKTTFYLNLLR